jgi:hypothetical protein
LKTDKPNVILQFEICLPFSLAKNEMTILRLKILVCLIWIFSSIFLFSPENLWLIVGNAGLAEDKPGINVKPKNELIDRFDRAIQQRFLTEPNFGIRRIIPIPPPNPHLESFYPITNEEITSVANFEKEGWKVDLYLFGRRAMPKLTDGKESKNFSIEYRLNKPLPVTKGLKAADLPKAEKLLKEVKTAFLEFQNRNSPNENNYEFSIGKWSYVAKPVRAANQSCLKCHTDYVITSKLENNQYKFRRRQVGDANGVLVYGFSKPE